MRKFAAVFFWVAAAALVGVIVYGAATAGLTNDHGWEVYPRDRLLATDTAAGVAAEVRVAGLARAPALVVRTRGLRPRAAMEIYLTGADGAPPVRLRTAAPGDTGAYHARITLPPGALRRYRRVTGVQNGRVVFRASLS